MVTLRELLGMKHPDCRKFSELAALSQDRFGLDASLASLTDAERVNAEALFREEIGTDEFVGRSKSRQLRAVTLAGASGRRGNHHSLPAPGGPGAKPHSGGPDYRGFLCHAAAVIYDLESRLRGVYLDDMASRAGLFRASRC